MVKRPPCQVAEAYQSARFSRLVAQHAEAAPRARIARVATNRFMPSAIASTCLRWHYTAEAKSRKGEESRRPQVASGESKTGRESGERNGP